MLSLSREARQAIDQFQGRMSGQLGVGGSTIPGEYLLPSLIGQFREKYPEISISLLIGSSRQVSDWVEEGKLEVGVVGARPAARALDARELTTDELVVIVPAGHPWWSRGTVSLTDFLAEPLILRERGSGSREALERALADVDLDLSSLRIVGEFGSTQAAKQAVRAGVGVTLISKRAVMDECQAGFVSCATVEGLTESRSFYLIVHRDRSRSPLAIAFLEFLESQFPPMAS